jgi:hypothetical protein
MLCKDWNDRLVRFTLVDVSVGKGIKKLWQRMATVCRIDDLPNIHQELWEVNVMRLTDHQ